ncbi:hypothetical protein B0F90DRAFT_1726935 [Multifurca ochricompacta]|uniref:Uncharacterized protein n=1 Tax=Multifurca ochricompacta TaxID=376703 RepID=A0AAD4QKD7_9AGAM|nr:hypothetical protein B0F90DRAFT_1726935 [Multifurca ochricompacta]
MCSRKPLCVVNTFSSVALWFFDRFLIAIACITPESLRTQQEIFTGQARDGPLHEGHRPWVTTSLRIQSYLGHANSGDRNVSLSEQRLASIRGFMGMQEQEILNKRFVASRLDFAVISLPA